ncbi:maleylpyruvate isomerase N-terminal domain-containing protein [Pseudolysinimonas yzui]|uniref:Mycothiol-dependent maleylpyruvate isomerase metal-binding domain-containing protein n=1 Tax=Pseudolysinimonas yzui TaxID=2708254 RepID=A0A8J3GSV5_9MICO|nr:maleylpyruvate isomerase N-terminal domain-containing protein [Pseudolysinimonas yzui]GHF27468.1 hypothetical protein GCM10011600_30400 [Pseudolysinimonas yzui]
MPGRSDLVVDPEIRDQLLLARRGQAYWARRLAALPDAGFSAPSLIPGVSRRLLIAHVGIQARAAAMRVHSARTGAAPDPAELGDQFLDVRFASTLPVEALRHLCAHAAVHLNVEWRDSPPDVWERVRDTVWSRTKEVWVRALQLGSGGSENELPFGLVERIRAEGWPIEITDIRNPRFD